LKEEKVRRKKERKFVFPDYSSFLLRVIANSFDCFVIFTPNELPMALTDYDVTKEVVVDYFGAIQT
jgi:hypothetical protein